MLEPLIHAIQAAVKPEKIDAYYSRQIVLPPAEPEVEPIAINTLQGIVDWFNSTLDSEQDEAIAIHVYSENEVFVIGGEHGRHRQRDRWIHATCSKVIGRGFSFGQWMDIETFIINVQSHFVSTENTAKLLKIVGNLESGESIRTEDDGISQIAAVKSGVRRLSEEILPNPILLAPYRSFPEIEQPESSFVFRLKQGDRGVSAALFEADGGQWKLDAITRIKAFFNENLPEVDVIA